MRYKQPTHKGVIYQIKNKITKSVYIGQTKHNIENRLSCHIRELKQGWHCCKTMQSDFNKHGASAFEATIIYTIKRRDYKAFKQLMNKKEKYAMTKVNGKIYNSNGKTVPAITRKRNGTYIFS